jgi:hypothetical protein
MNIPLTTNIEFKGSWNEVLNDCRFTVNKFDITNEPSDEFKESILFAEHSPIRDIIVCWDWIDIPQWVAVHYVRHHVGIEKFVSTSREDRTDVPRSERKQTDLVNIRCKANIQSLIDIARVRLCTCASKETREYFEDLKRELTKIDPFIGNILAPNCIYRGACTEGFNKSCNAWKKYLVDTWTDIVSLDTRYQIYNDWFKENKKG